MHSNCRSNIVVVKWENKWSTSTIVELSGHKIENPYYSNRKSEFIYVISMTENLLVPFFMSSDEILTKPNLT